MRLQQPEEKVGHLTLSHKEMSMGGYKPILRDNSRGVGHMLTLGPDFKCFIICLILANLLSGFLLFRLNRREQGRLYFLVHLVLLIYLDLSWIMCALINPGIAIETEDQEGSDKCQECAMAGLQISKKQGRFHCKKCGVCIDQAKHHCAVTGNCIGKNNFIASYLFILGTFLWIIDLAATLPFVYYL